MLKISEIIKATNGKLIQGNGKSAVQGVSTDTRTIKKGDLFVAIKGENFDGHNFVNNIAGKGAGAAMVCSDSGIFNSGICIIRVKDTRRAYGDLANFYRRKFAIPFVGVTGSNGKTTTKEMLGRILSKKYKVLKSRDNNNNDIGVPMTIFRLEEETNACVAELGTNHFGEMRRLSEILKPDISIITNIAASHIENFKDLSGVLKEKSEILCGMDKKGVLIINSDDNILKRLNTSCRKITFGISSDCDFRAKNIKNLGNGYRFEAEGEEFVIPVLGYHNIYNALAAIACAKMFGVGYDNIKNALLQYRTQDMRMQYNILKGVSLINDAYNSNPLSLERAIETLCAFKGRGRKILVAGDMLELGTRSIQYHRRLGEYAAKRGVDYLIGIGKFSRQMCAQARKAGMNRRQIFWFSNHGECAQTLAEVAKKGDVVLVKGSRAMKMEQILECFTTSYTR